MSEWAEEYRHICPQILRKFRCSRLRDLYPNHMTKFLTHIIRLYRKNEISLLTVSLLCRELVSTIPATAWAIPSKIIPLLKLADVAWYVQNDKGNDPYVQEILTALNSDSFLSLLENG